MLAGRGAAWRESPGLAVGVVPWVRHGSQKRKTKKTKVAEEGENVPVRHACACACILHHCDAALGLATKAWPLGPVFRQRLETGIVPPCLSVGPVLPPGGQCTGQMLDDMCKTRASNDQCGRQKQWTLRKDYI